MIKRIPELGESSPPPRETAPKSQKLDNARRRTKTTGRAALKGITITVP
jgi:hypothetical protein